MGNTNDLPKEIELIEFSSKNRSHTHMNASYEELIRIIDELSGPFEESSDIYSDINTLTENYLNEKFTDVNSNEANTANEIDKINDDSDESDEFIEFKSNLGTDSIDLDESSVDSDDSLSFLDDMSEYTQFKSYPWTEKAVDTFKCIVDLFLPHPVFLNYLAHNCNYDSNILISIQTEMSISLNTSLEQLFAIYCYLSYDTLTLDDKLPEDNVNTNNHISDKYVSLCAKQIIYNIMIISNININKLWYFMDSHPIQVIASLCKADEQSTHFIGTCVRGLIHTQYLIHNERRYKCKKKLETTLDNYEYKDLEEGSDEEINKVDNLRVVGRKHFSDSIRVMGEEIPPLNISLEDQKILAKLLQRYLDTDQHIYFRIFLNALILFKVEKRLTTGPLETLDDIKYLLNRPWYHLILANALLYIHY